MSNNLRQLRITLGLSQKQFAQRTGVPAQFISEFERDIHNNKQHNVYLSNINAFLAQYNLTLQLDIRSSENKQPHFISGHVYKISTNKNFNGSDTPCPENNCSFIYISKQGKHHCFKEARGGWSRTYTDAQLIGKFIQEVNRES